MKKTIVASLAVVLFAGLGGANWLANAVNHKGYHQMPLLKMKKELKLSDSQFEQIKSIMGDKEQRHQKWMSFKNKKKELGQLMRSPNSNKEEALKLSQEIAQAQQAMQQQRIEDYYAVKALLTPEQIKKFNEKMAQREAKMLQESPHQKMWEKARPQDALLGQ